jgi:hypothetical protein
MTVASLKRDARRCCSLAASLVMLVCLVVMCTLTACGATSGKVNGTGKMRTSGGASAVAPSVTQPVVRAKGCLGKAGIEIVRRSSGARHQGIQERETARRDGAPVTNSEYRTALRRCDMTPGRKKS